MPLINMINLFQLTYKADSIQIGFLHLLSSKATQNITYHCKNSAAYFDVAKHTFRRGLKLMSWNDVEITPKGKLRYEATLDECKVMTSSLIKILYYNQHFYFSTTKTPGQKLN